jgi:hypothetical protein
MWSARSVPELYKYLTATALETQTSQDFPVWVTSVVRRQRRFSRTPHEQLNVARRCETGGWVSRLADFGWLAGQSCRVSCMANPPDGRIGGGADFG